MVIPGLAKKVESENFSKSVRVPEQSYTKTNSMESGIEFIINQTSKKQIL